MIIGLRARSISSSLLAKAQDIRDYVCCFPRVENELRHRRMWVRQPNVQPDCGASGGVRDHPEIRSVGKADWRFLTRRYDVARSASAEREVMTPPADCPELAVGEPLRGVMAGSEAIRGQLERAAPDTESVGSDPHPQAAWSSYDRARR